MSARRNLPLFVAYQIASQEGLAHGIYLVWLLVTKHLTAQTAAIILAAGEVATVILQVPTGMLADRFGRRGSLIAGSVAQIAGLLYFWLGSTPAALFAGATLIAVGDSFRSGADEALLYSSCRMIGQEDRFGVILARTQSASTVGMAILIAVGGRLSAVYGMGAAWAGETALCVVGLVLALAMVPVNALSPPDELDEPAALDLHLPSLSLLATAILPATLCGALLAALELFTQVSWPAWGVERLTWVIAAGILVEAVGAAIAERLQARVPITGLGLAGIAAGASWGLAGLASFWAISLLEGWMKPLRGELIQREAADHQRAQAASWAGALDTAVSVTILPIAAFLLDRLGASAACVALALTAGVIGAGTWIAACRHREASS